MPYDDDVQSQARASTDKIYSRNKSDFTLIEHLKEIDWCSGLLYLWDQTVVFWACDIDTVRKYVPIDCRELLLYFYYRK